MQSNMKQVPDDGMSEEMKLLSAMQGQHGQRDTHSMEQPVAQGASDKPKDEKGVPELTYEEYSDIFSEIEEQPHWRFIADKEMDYADGNQLDSALLQRQAELGIPPAIEDLIGPSLLSIQGYESMSRTDWRVTPNGETGGKDVADALNYKLNQAERQSKADRACSEAFRPQIAVGVGFVEVKRDNDPFKFPYRCAGIHRNEIHWDMKARESDLSDARWLRRQRWLTPERLKLTFPKHKELIKQLSAHGANWWSELDSATLDGGMSTGLQNAWNEARAWTHQEDRWYNQSTKEMCVSELWYRRWMNVSVIKTPDGRAVEYDENNLNHAVAVASGATKPLQATVARVRRAYWLGPHLLNDSASPYPHRHFPYVPFWGFSEDNTGIPYGYVRGMKYAQDSLNSGQSKLRWGMSVTRVERTKGAVAMSDAQLRSQVARPDADVVLDADHMARPGARFEVKRDYQLTDQHYQMLQDNRQTIERTSTVTAGFQGKPGSATSGLQEQTQVEQSNQSLARIMDNFREGRTMVGELLMAMIVEDLGKEEQTIIIEGDAVREDRSVSINKPEEDPETGAKYLSNDLQRTMLKVALEDVPSTSSYRGQQLSSMSEAIKSLPPEYQAAVTPFLVSLMDVPFKRDVVEAIKGVQQQATPEETEQKIKDAVKDALAKANTDLKERELDIKERKADSEVKNLDAKAVQVGVQAAFSAMQAGAQVAEQPMIAPIADAVMQGAGYQRPNPAGQDPNFPVPEQGLPQEQGGLPPEQQPIQPEQGNLPPEQGAIPPEQMAPEQPAQDSDLSQVNKNTSPGFPPIPETPEAGMNGIETPSTDDNLPDGSL